MSMLFSVSLFPDNIKQDAVTTTSHRKCLIGVLKKRNLLESSLSTIWENTDGCSDQYICVSALYLMSFMPQCHSVIIDHGISAPGHVKEMVYGINTIGKHYIHQLMSNVQPNGSKKICTRILMHSITQKKDVSMDK